MAEILTTDYGLNDLPTGDPGDQVVEFGYSPTGWDDEYEPSDTLDSVATSSAALRDIYAAYPNSEFFIIGHSLGGIVALDALARDAESLFTNTGGVITVSSPVQGLRDLTAGTAGAAIEILACRQVPQVDGSSKVWGDLARSGDAITLIKEQDWSQLRVVNFGNEKDLVVDADTAMLPSHFEVSCYDVGTERFLELNHDTLLNQPPLAAELLAVLLDGEAPTHSC